MKKKKGYFDESQNAFTGLAGMGVATAVGAGIQAKAPAGTPSIMPAFSAGASMAPIAVTATMGGGILNSLRGMGKTSKRRRR